jgi:hypothetical protein
MKFLIKFIKIFLTHQIYNLFILKLIFHKEKNITFVILLWISGNI